MNQRCCDICMWYSVSIGIGVKNGNVRWIGGAFVMSMKMTNRWKKKIIEIYEEEGEHYYQYIKKCRQIRERLGMEESVRLFDMALEVLEERRKEGIVDYGYKDQFIGVIGKK